jgi:predicted  nucleic acid-binding Zn-ribbon protein
MIDSLQQVLKLILEIQEFDMQMIQLMRLKRERQRELDNMNGIKADLASKLNLKENEITELKTSIRMIEGELADVVAEMKKLEAKQNAVKKLEEFNALTHEMTAKEKERISKEQHLSEIMDKLANSEDHQKTLEQQLSTTKESSAVLETEIIDGISRINEEGIGLKQQRDKLAKNAPQDIFKIYERLLNNKRDRVIVPIENRCCSGCHIMLTPQDENLVRRGERLVFCEHCSRIHYWPETKAAEGEEEGAARPRRRRTTKVA